MAGLIPKQFIDDLLARADIVDVIDARVKLKKAGRNYQACCPFHSEKSPSFTVSQEKQFYHCFGCGEHGNVISFLMEYERLDFVDAIEELAGLFNLTVPREQDNLTPAQQQKQRQIHQQKQNDFELMSNISRFYQLQLKQHNDKNKVIDYLKGRGLTGEIVKQFGIGYAPDEWNSVTGQFGQSINSSKQLIDLGMAIAGEKNRPYDRFRGRIMFPIRDKRGRVIGFGGRIIDDGTPKYLNSPETRIYSKGQELYGLYEAKLNNNNLETLVVVEGYMDVVALAQHGINYAVASLGTSTTSEQLQSLFRTVKQVVCCYDGDRAGREAAWRAMENALPLIRDGLTLKFVFLPDGEDPDSLVRDQGKAAFEQLLAQATPLSNFLFSQLMSNIDISTLEGQASLIELFMPYIDKMPESNIRESIVEQLANRVGKTGAQIAKSLTPTSNTQIKTPKKPTKSSPVRLAIALLLEHPHLAKLMPDINALTQIQLPGIELLKQLLFLCQQNPQINSGNILEHYRDTPEGAQLAKLLCWQHHIDADSADNVFLDTLEKLFNTFVEQRTENLLQKARTGNMSKAEKHELQTLLNAKA